MQGSSVYGGGEPPVKLVRAGFRGISVVFFFFEAKKFQCLGRSVYSVG